VYFPSKFLAEMRDTKNSRFELVKTVLAKISGQKLSAETFLAKMMSLL
jgi:hypothetical protein